jgi:hypothetical protein
MQEYWYSGGSSGTLYLFLIYVEVDLLSWGGRRPPDSRGNSLVSLLENNHCNKAFLDQTGVIIRTNAIGALLQHHMLWMGIWVHPYTVIPVQVGAKVLENWGKVEPKLCCGVMVEALNHH